MSVEMSFVVIEDILKTIKESGAKPTDKVEIRVDKMNPNNRQDIIEVWLNKKIIATYNDCM